MIKKTLYYDEMLILPEEFLEDYNSFKFSAKELSNDELIANGCNILLSRSTIKVNEKLLNNVPLEYYATATAGFDHVDVEYLSNNQVKYFIASGCNSNSVAEYVLLNIAKYRNIKSLKYTDLCIGIIGFGNIGRKVAYYCNLLGIKVLINDPILKENNFKFPEYFEYVDLEKLLKTANVITNHVPYCDNGKYQTSNLLNENLNLLQNNCLFIHSSRGGIVNESLLINNIKEKNIFAVVDVWEDEPLLNNELLTLCKIATPHIAGHTINAKLNASQMILNDMFMQGIANETFILGNRKEEYTILSNIIEKLEIARNRRKINEDSVWLKSNPSSFSEFRKNYPQRNESLFCKM